MSFNTINLIVIMLIISNLQVFIRSIPAGLKCPELHVKNGNYKLNENGASAILKCDKNYFLFGREEIYCINGTWTKKLPFCTHNDCIDEHLDTILKGTGYTTVYVTQDKVTIIHECNSKFTLKGNQNVTCIDGKFFGEHPTCVPKQNKKMH
ncbi:C4b-binding protein beta chain-like [Leptopilina boulardi]|uniref:C4b-binding protein beta chain-like n=1 Tax=Leptopilina boulardi TaxID=63433 RepID=UPI0021F535C2|nr:C4b-binding protein beta chain-like [Leptopilina boulardi]